MSTIETISTPEAHPNVVEQRPEGARTTDAIVIVWSKDEPARIGEIAFVPSSIRGAVLGRGKGEENPEIPRLQFIRQRPGAIEDRGPLITPTISREQLRITSENGGIRVEQLGRHPLLVQGKPTKSAFLEPFQTFELRGQLLLYYVRRPQWLTPLKFYTDTLTRPFGEPDLYGIIGESPIAWRLRDELACAAQLDKHVLILGPSGTGKELAAMAVHQQSRRGDKAWISRNASTLPAGLVDSELFGHAKNYPQAGMPERQGIIGLAHNSTLFLDEVGEMSSESQAHLLRVLDNQGEYTRLGESQTRRSHFRLIAATNRAPESLKHDFVARFPIRIVVPPLQDRREDIPLLVRTLLAGVAAKCSPSSGETKDVVAEALRVPIGLMDRLMQRSFTCHVRELEEILLSEFMKRSTSLVSDPSGTEEEAAPTRSEALIDANSSPKEDGTTAGENATTDNAATPTKSRPRCTEAHVKGALQRNGNVVRRAARDLGISRYRLYRLMKKYNLV